MEVDKFEKHIKRHLKEREITPSEAAWDKLSGQLPVAAPKKKNRFIWYSAAAVFVGVLIVSILYFKIRMAFGDTQTEVAKTPSGKIDVPKEGEDLANPTQEEVELVGAKKGVIQNEGNTVVVLPKETIKGRAEFPALVKEEGRGDGLNTFKTKTEQLIDAKITELAVQVELLEDRGHQMTDTEVDSLLRKAQQEILRDKITNGNKKVDAMALLDEVENELDQTFREQILESLKTGFLKVRTAVADRNN
ncbi:MAG: hypothetical protein CR994_06305 [Maribacter sp.]|nr:MAG: hypothetical protein CR994_06305 [Maribacter sp.]